jgi:serine/threonine protein kinase
MKIWVKSLEYDFRYTRFASTEAFIAERKKYLTITLNAPTSVIFDMPTPRHDTRTIGQWTLNDPLGKGSVGRVFLASNSKNQVVAVKIMECTSRSGRAVDEEIARWRDLTALAKNRDDGGRIVWLKETIDPREEMFSSSTTFEDVALVLEPMAPQTLDDIVRNGSTG